MDSSEFVRMTRRQAGSIAMYINHMAPAMVVQKTLRFVDDNFRAQGWQGATFQPWQKQKIRRGSILIMTGRLRRGINHYSNGKGEVRFYNNVPYAKIHNEGGKIVVKQNVRAFTRRRIYTDEVSAPRAKKPKFIKKHIGESTVRPFTRIMKMNIPQRQFAPYEGHESPFLNDQIKQELEKEMNRILSFK